MDKRTVGDYFRVGFQESGGDPRAIRDFGQLCGVLAMDGVGGWWKWKGECTSSCLGLSGRDGEDLGGADHDGEQEVLELHIGVR